MSVILCSLAAAVSLNRTLWRCNSRKTHTCDFLQCVLIVSIHFVTCIIDAYEKNELETRGIALLNVKIKYQVNMKSESLQFAPVFLSEFIDFLIRHESYPLFK